MEKDTNYWSLHKETWDELLSELDNEVITKIYNNPNCAEGRLFSRKVEKEVKQRLLLQVD